MQYINLKMPDGVVRQFYHRGSDADLGVLDQIFKKRDYSLQQIWRGQEMRDIGKAMARPLIIDAGANMGASAVWFTMGFPHAHLVGIEPDAGNADLLARNTVGLDVDIRHAAIGSRDGVVEVINIGNGEWGYQTKPIDETSDGASDPTPDGIGQVPLLSMDRLVNEKVAAGYQPFIAKIDIEGAETELFSQSTGWIDHFPLVIVELHDWMIPGQARSRAFLQAISARDRDFVQVGENTFSIRNDPVAA